MNIKLGIMLLGMILVTWIPEIKPSQETKEPFVPDLNGYSYIYDSRELEFQTGGPISNKDFITPVIIIQEKEQHPWIQIKDGNAIYWLNLEAPDFIYKKHVK
jgi:hypothetical protein